jgi:hypothetical protein
VSKNERKTENVVREELRRYGYYDPTSDIQVEEQKSNIDAVKRSLKAASKSGGGGNGAPEFIISAPSSPDFLILVECKADTKDHISSHMIDFLNGGSLTEDDAARVSLGAKSGYQCSAYAANFSFSNQASYC